jgi:hypothetical protein
MRVWDAFKSATVADLEPVDLKALYVLAAPSTPEPVREAVIERAREGERITHTDAKAVVQIARRATKDARPKGACRRLPKSPDQTSRTVG